MSAKLTKVHAYVLVATPLSAAIAALAVASDGSIDLRVALIFGALCFLAENFSVTMAMGTTYSVSFVITIAAIVAAGPGEAVIAALFAATSVRDIKNRPLIRNIFNAAQLAASTGAGGLVYVWLDGPPAAGAAGLFPDALVPLLACTVTNFLCNTLMVSGAVALSEKRSISEIWKTQYSGLLKTYTAFALLGLLLAALYIEIRWGSVLFLLMPLLVARHAFQAAINLQISYDATVRSLITAIEAKDPYTRGHAERVSRLAEMTARAYGLPEDRCRSIRYAALMHDVGKLGVLSTVLQKPGKLTAEEYEHMKVHPIRGVEIVGEIDALKDALVGVRHHHERLDGKGYPDGLAGEEIPLFARLITVSDAFDSMTSTRVYRKAKSVEEAFEELHNWAGKMFDPRAIAALEKAIARHGWEPISEYEDEPGHEEPSTGGAGDARAASV